MNYHILTSGEEHVASTIHGEEAACLVAFLGEGAKICDCWFDVVWEEGQEEFSASESYDRVVEVITSREKV